MTAPYITALPTPPSRADDPQNFATKADAFLGALPGFRTEANTLGDYMETKAGEAAASASAADADRIAAQAAAADADADRVAAGNSAAASASSAASASGSAAAAAASYDSFDDRYLGAKSSDPTTDNDGNALLVGAIYFNTGSGFRGWNGSAWVALPAATAGATAFTPAGSIAATNVQAAIAELDSEKVSAVDAVSTNTANKVVKRDASGNFSAGTITAALAGNASTATALQTGRTISVTGDATGTSAAFTGSANVSIPVTVVDNSHNHDGSTVPIDSGAAVAASGTSVDFTGIPNWVNRITVLLDRISSSGSSQVVLRLGTAGGPITTGYRSSAGVTTTSAACQADENTTCALAAYLGSASFIYDGVITFVKMSSSVWAWFGCIGLGTGRVGFIAGSLSGAGVIDRLRLTMLNGTDSFDAGSINITWE